MDLGLGELTDDQLLELLQQACAELGQRDAYVRDMAQHTITKAGKGRSLRLKLLEEAVETVRVNYVEDIRKETLAEVKHAVAAGTIRLLTSEQEARCAVESTLEAKIKLIDETAQAIQLGGMPQRREPETDFTRRPPYDPRYEYDRDWRKRMDQARMDQIRLNPNSPFLKKP